MLCRLQTRRGSNKGILPAKARPAVPNMSCLAILNQKPIGNSFETNLTG